MTRNKYTLLKWRGEGYRVHLPPPYPYIVGRGVNKWDNDSAWRVIATFDTKAEAEAMEKLMPEWTPDKEQEHV